jgi:hypothetical protein
VSDNGHGSQWGSLRRFLNSSSSGPCPTRTGDTEHGEDEEAGPAVIAWGCFIMPLVWIIAGLLLYIFY